MKSVAIMQPYVFPYIGYFQLIDAVDIFVSYDDVQYMKGGWINRNRVLVNGKPKFITFPVSRTKLSARINECFLTEHILHREKRKILSLLRQNYSKTPFYNEVFPIIEDVISTDETNIARFSEHSQKEIIKYLDIEVSYKRSSELDYDKSLTGQARVIEIVRKLNAIQYVNPIGGINLYTPAEFSRNKIDLKFLQSKFGPYRQFQTNFVPDLSIIDVLMFNSKDTVKCKLKQFRLFSEDVL